MPTVATVVDRPRESRRAALAAAALALALSGTSAHATIYKCDGPDSTPVYQDTPCAAGRQLRDFDKDPPSVSVLPLAPSPSPAPVAGQPAPTTRAVAREKAPPKGKTADVQTRESGAAQRKFLAPGINEGQVLARLGPPDTKSGGGTRKVARWTYLPAADDPGTVTTLTFESGRLVEVERKVVR